MALQPKTPKTHQPKLPDTWGNMMCSLQENIEREIRERQQQQEPVKMRYTVTVNVLPEHVSAYLDDGWEIA